MPAVWKPTHPNLYPLAGDDRRLTYLNGAVQIRVGLELPEMTQFCREAEILGMHQNPQKSSGTREKNPIDNARNQDGGPNVRISAPCHHSTSPAFLRTKILDAHNP